MSTPWIAVVTALCVYSLFLGALVVGLLRRIGTVLDRAEARLSEPISVRLPGLEPGMLVPTFQGFDDAGDAFGSAQLLGRPSLLIFLSPDCEPCRSLAASLQNAGDLVGAEVLAVLSDSPEGRAFADRLSIKVIYQSDHEISRAFQTTATPYVFALDEEGRVVNAATANTVEGLKTIALSFAKGR